MKKKTQKIVICGYYGHENFGDEAILRVILSKIKKQNPEAKILILSPKNIFSATRDMSGADVFIFGGGSILQNSTSDGSLFCYLAIIGASNLLCKRKIMLANGLGPFIQRKIPLKILLSAIKRVINCFDFISVRDFDSQKTLNKLLPHRKIHLVPDPALILFQNINQKLTNAPKAYPEKDFFVYIPHANSLKKSQINTNQLAESLKNLSQKRNLRIKIVVLNEKEDLPLAYEISVRISDVQMVTPKNEEEAANDFLGAKFVISSRYHGSLLAAALGKATLSVSTDPKMQALCKDFFLFPTQSHAIFGNPHSLNAYVEKMFDFHMKNTRKTEDNIQKLSAKSEKSLKNIFDKF